MTKVQQIVEHVVVTFVEAGAAYLIVIPSVNWNKAIIAGAIGAGLSAAYNVIRQSEPTLAATLPVAPVVKTPVITPATTDIPPTTPSSVGLQS